MSRFEGSPQHKVRMNTGIVNIMRLEFLAVDRNQYVEDERQVSKLNIGRSVFQEK